MDSKHYKFDVNKIKRQQATCKTPVVIVSCGSFSPITYLHLRMFEMARDTFMEHEKYELVGGYFSPVSDQYKKVGLIEATHRVKMCELGAEDSEWVMVDCWESAQPEYQRTINVLHHFNYELNDRHGGILDAEGKRKRIKIMLLAGGDLILSFAEPGLWQDEDIQEILQVYGCCVVERTGSDIHTFLIAHDALYANRRNIIVIKQLIYNDISSTKVRLYVKREMSIKYLVSEPIRQYIIANKLYYPLNAMEDDQC